ncbi:hypothetical protein [Lactobacillus taiwanensis]|uniref:hypothetical protein n=2 Tax=Lactobacillus taiwanensis TaxID=508451 RepID=UPI001AEBB442|nr:hypothetical protein [Lactobacillus taiwanensis]QTQ39170.1 hypothetical protein H1A07_04620 [Lactobacillus taiwanensis]
MKSKFLRILGLVAAVGLGLVIVFQVILTMNTNTIKNSSPATVNSATSNSSDKEIIAEALNTDFKSYRFKVKNSPGIQATRTWTGEYQNDPLKAQAKVDKTSMWLNDDKVYQKMWDNTGSPKWKASSTMTPNKVVSQFDPAIILSGSKAIKSDMKLKKSGSIYKVSYSGNSLRFWNKTHSKLIKKLKGNASGLDNEGALKQLKVEYTLKEKGGHLVLTSFTFYLHFAYAGYDISQEGTYTQINAIKVSTPSALKSKTSKKSHRVYHPKADDSFDINIDTAKENSQSSQSSSSSSSSQQSSSTQSSKSEEHKDEKQESQSQSQSQSSTPAQSSDNKESNQQPQHNESHTNNNQHQGQAQNNQQASSSQSH